jgi:hypothetical protein
MQKKNYLHSSLFHTKYVITIIFVQNFKKIEKFQARFLKSVFLKLTPYCTELSIYTLIDHFDRLPANTGATTW